MDDPFAVLGLDPDASEGALRAARRRLAKALHPDHQGGDTAAMGRLNAAFDAALVELGRRDRPADPSGRSSRAGDGAGPAAPPAPPQSAPPRPGGRFAHDVASFTIEALPAEAFEALLIVAAWLGELLIDEPPYQLDVALGAPYDCWCRLDLVPDAGATTVAVTLASIDGRPVPDIDVVRDAWVADLNRLGRPE